MPGIAERTECSKFPILRRERLSRRRALFALCLWAGGPNGIAPNFLLIHIWPGASFELEELWRDPNLYAYAQVNSAPSKNIWAE